MFPHNMDLGSKVIATYPVDAQDPAPALRRCDSSQADDDHNSTDGAENAAYDEGGGAEVDGAPGNVDDGVDGAEEHDEPDAGDAQEAAL